MENNTAPENVKLKHAMCYVPIVAFILFFTENNKSQELMKHIKYGGSLFIIYFVLQTILGFAIGAILALAYVGIIGFLGFKAYNGEDIDLEHIDNLEKKIKDNFETDKKSEKK